MDLHDNFKMQTVEYEIVWAKQHLRSIGNEISMPRLPENRAKILSQLTFFDEQIARIRALLQEQTNERHAA